MDGRLGPSASPQTLRGKERDRKQERGVDSVREQQSLHRN